MHSRKIAIIAILVALSIGTNYAMLSMPNVKFMDLIVFVSGFCFGPVIGMLTGILSWMVYGTLNPQGFLLPIWVATMLSETLYGLAGALIRRTISPRELSEFKSLNLNRGVFFGISGIFLTFAYDLITNIVFGYVGNMSIEFAVIFGFVTFGLVHMISNGLFFGLCCGPAINALLRIVGGENSGIHEK